VTEVGSFSSNQAVFNYETIGDGEPVLFCTAICCAGQQPLSASGKTKISYACRFRPLKTLSFVALSDSAIKGWAFMVKISFTILQKRG